LHSDVAIPAASSLTQDETARWSPFPAQTRSGSIEGESEHASCEPNSRIVRMDPDDPGKARDWSDREVWDPARHENDGALARPFPDISPTIKSGASIVSVGINSEWTATRSGGGGGSWEVDIKAAGGSVGGPQVAFSLTSNSLAHVGPTAAVTDTIGAPTAPGAPLGDVCAFDAAAKLGGSSSCGGPSALLPGRTATRSGKPPLWRGPRGPSSSALVAEATVRRAQNAASAAPAGSEGRMSMGGTAGDDVPGGVWGWGAGEGPDSSLCSGWWLTEEATVARAGGFVSARADREQCGVMLMADVTRIGVGAAAGEARPILLPEEKRCWQGGEERESRLGAHGAFESWGGAEVWSPGCAGELGDPDPEGGEQTPHLSGEGAGLCKSFPFFLAEGWD
jgi:hypothetical protein